MPKTTTILLDCDNTLVLSEVLAFEACAELVTEILHKYNIDKTYTGPELIKDFVGQNFRGMMMTLQKQYGFTMPDKQIEDYVAMELGKVVEKLEKAAQPCPGAIEQVKRLHEMQEDGKPRYRLAVVSSSASSRVEASIRKVGLDPYLPSKWVYSAASSLPKPTSKPDPAVYIYAMEQLGVKPEECVAVEDSKSGATAAMRAKIPLVGYVGPYEDKEEQEHMVKVLKEECGADAIMYHWDEFPKCLEQIEKAGNKS